MCIRDSPITATDHFAACLEDVGRTGQALVLRREVYASFVALLGVSHDRTIRTGGKLTALLVDSHLWGETKQLLRNKLLPAAQRSLGTEHELIIRLKLHLVTALCDDPEHTRDDPALNQHDPWRGVGRNPVLISSQATTCGKPRPHCRT